MEPDSGKMRWRTGDRVWLWLGETSSVAGMPSGEGSVLNVTPDGVAWVRWHSGDNAGWTEPVHPSDGTVRVQERAA